MTHVGRSAGVVQEAARELGNAKTSARPASPISVDGNSVLERVVSTTFAAAGDAVIIAFLVLFLLLLRNRLRARIIDIAVPIRIAGGWRRESLMISRRRYSSSCSSSC
jgi:hypothetical protein